MDTTDIGYAVRLMKRGRRVRRRGWRDKTRFLWLKQHVMIKSDWCKDPQLKQLADEAGGEIFGLGTVCMYSAHGAGDGPVILTGWLPTACDLLADDWMELEDGESVQDA